MFFQNSTIGYTIFVTDVYIKRFNFSSKDAALLLEVPYLIVMFLGPVYGMVIDKIGYRMWLITGCGLLLVVAHVIFIVTPDCDKCWITVVPMVFFGIGMTNLYTLSNGALIPFLVPEENVGLAFGINYAV